VTITGWRISSRRTSTGAPSTAPKTPSRSRASCCAPRTATCPHGLEALDREISAYLANGRVRGKNGQPGKKWADKNKSTIYSHLKAFYDWAVAAGELDFSPMGGVRRPKVPATDPKPWTDQQLVELLRYACQPWRLAVVLASYAGLRCCEIARLAPEHRRMGVVRYRDETGRLVEVESEVLRITGKGGKTAEVEVHDRVRQELANFPGTAPYILQAGGRANAREPGQGDARWLSREAARYFREQLDLRVTLHQGRHWYTTGVYEVDQDLRAAQSAARHTSINSTVGYTALRNGQRRRGILALPVLDSAA